MKAPPSIGHILRRLREGRRKFTLGFAAFVAIALVVQWWDYTFQRALETLGKASLDSVEFTLPANQSIELGWQDLGQSPGAQSAETRHIRFSRVDDAIYVSNVAQSKRLDLVFGGVAGRPVRAFAETVPISPGSQGEALLADSFVRVKSQRESGSGNLRVTIEAPQGHHFVATGRSADQLGWQWSESTAKPGPCSVPTRAEVLRGFLRSRLGGVSLARLLGGERQKASDLAYLGGAIDCMDGDILQVGGLGSPKEPVPWRSFLISGLGDTMFLGAFEAQSRGAVPVAFRLTRPDGVAEPPVTQFSDIKWRIDKSGPFGPLQQLVAGSTTYEVHLSDATRKDRDVKIALRAVERAPLFDADTCATDETRAHCPHPLDEHCANGAMHCPFPRNFAADAATSGCQPLETSDRHGGDQTICWNWRRDANPLNDAAGFEKQIGSRGVALVRLALLMATLAFAIGAYGSRLTRIASGVFTGAVALFCIINPLSLTAGVVVRLQAGFVASLLFVLLVALGSLRDKTPRAIVALLAPWTCCVLAFSNEILSLLGTSVTPATAWLAFLANWTIAGLLLTLTESSAQLALFWLALTLLSALGENNLMTMALDGSSDKFIESFFKHRLIFLEMLPPLAAVAATTPEGVLGRSLDRFAALESLGIRSRLRGVGELILALWNALLSLKERWRGGNLYSSPRRGVYREVDYTKTDAGGQRLELASNHFAMARRSFAGVGFALLRISAGVVLFGAMILWASTSRQTGLDVFQPAEFAKFAVILVCARALMRMFAVAAEGETANGRSLGAIIADLGILVAFIVTAVAALALGLEAGVERMPGRTPHYLVLSLLCAGVIVSGGIALRRQLLSIGLSLMLLILFVGVMIFVPSAQSDWSPALIMGALVCAIVTIFFISLGLRLGATLFRRVRARFKTPRAFMASPRAQWSALAAWAMFVVVFAAAGIFANIGFGLNPLSPFRSAYVLVAHLDRWKTSPEERLDALERSGLGGGRRVVVERLISMEDLQLGRSTSKRCAEAKDVESGGLNSQPDSIQARPCYIDSEIQLVLSRRVIASGPCGFGETIAPKEGAMSAIAGVFGLLASWVTPCGQARLTPPSIEPASPPPRPINVPVIDSDFAGAFLIAKLGVGAAIAAFAGQLLLVAAPIQACGSLFYIGLERGGPRRITGRLMLVVMSGCVALFVIQWAMSWSNILGLGPVMGQPMTLLANASSHHVFMVLPTLITFIIGIRYANMSPFVYYPRDPPD